MSDRTAAVKASNVQSEEIQELNPTDEIQDMTEMEQILNLLLENQSSSIETKQLIGNLPEAMEERIKALLKPTETKSETLQVTKQVQGIAEEQLKIAKANTEMLAQSLRTQEQQTESLNHQTSLLELLVTSNGLQMPSTEPESSEN